VGQFVCRLTLSKANSDRIKAKSRTTSRAGSEGLRRRNDSSFGPPHWLDETIAIFSFRSHLLKDLVALKLSSQAALRCE
jgi:hypothetical protein